MAKCLINNGAQVNIKTIVSVCVSESILRISH